MRSRPTALEIPRALLAALESRARAAYPEECCGVLVGRAGTGAGTEVRQVTALRPTANAANGDRSRRFAIAPVELLGIYREIRSRGDALIGYYHSHPDAVAEPSDLDLEAALPEVSYLIVSVDDRRVLDSRSWRLCADGSGFAEEPLVRGDANGFDTESG